MKKLWWFFAGLGMAAAIGELVRRRRFRLAGGLIDLNRADHEQLLQLAGMDEELAERIFDNRPYRSKFDLLNRRIMPASLYRQFKDRLYVDDRAAHEGIRTA